MTHAYRNGRYFGWSLFLLFGVIFLLFSNIGNWGCTYRAHQKYDKPPRKDAFGILDARYVKDEITREEYSLMQFRRQRPSSSAAPPDSRLADPRLPARASAPSSTTGLRSIRGLWRRSADRSFCPQPRSRQSALPTCA